MEHTSETEDWITHQTDFAVEAVEVVDTHSVDASRFTWWSTTHCQLFDERVWLTLRIISLPKHGHGAESEILYDHEAFDWFELPWVEDEWEASDMTLPEFLQHKRKEFANNLEERLVLGRR